MKNKSDKLTTKEDLKIPEQLKVTLDLEQARSETIKYVNKFLENEEKWNFINLLLKQLNSIRDKQKLCKTICEGLLKLTNSKICACFIFNLDTKIVEHKKIAYGETISNKKNATAFISKMNEKCCKFLQKTDNGEELSEFFALNSKNELILSPIICKDNFFGYLILMKDKPNFHQKNIHFINILTEHVALILENISLYQDSEKRNKTKMEFLAGISHEFKTPLNSIIGFSDLLKAKSKNLEDFKYVENISRSSKHLHSLIEDILDVSKYEANKLELNYSLFSTKEVITQTLLTLEEMYKEKSIDLSYTLTDVNIFADTKRFRQLIYNLVSNSIKFNKEKGKINIFTYTQDNQFFFEITDTGDGISKKNYDKIFGFFAQAHRNQLKRQQGSGIGLALCKVIAEAHLGQINFKSEIKKGSCFWFNLPLKRPGRFD